jgi:hypothetical protein
MQIRFDYLIKQVIKSIFYDWFFSNVRIAFFKWTGFLSFYLRILTEKLLSRESMQYDGEQTKFNALLTFVQKIKAPQLFQNQNFALILNEESVSKLCFTKVI